MLDFRSTTVLQLLIALAISVLTSMAVHVRVEAQDGQQPPQAIVEGRALRPDRTPLPFARVRLRNLASNAVGNRLMADHIGRFVFAMQPDGRYVVEIVDDTGRLRGTSESLTAVATRVTLTSATVSTCGPWTDALFGGTSLGAGPGTPGVLPPAGAAAQVAGQALRPDRVPMTTARVRLRTLPDGRALAYARVDGSGRFTFAGLGAGHYVVEISSDRGRALAASDALEVEESGSVLTSVTPESCAPWVAAWIVAGGAAAGAAAVVSVINNPASPER